jgi:GNAT superfamily N-acetyltransferase
MTRALVTTRPGGAADHDRVAALHDRCSASTLSRRYHAPPGHRHARLVDHVLRPESGWSVLAEIGDDVVGIASAGPLSTYAVEVGILVADAHQGRGIGGGLLRNVAVEAASRGYGSLVCVCQTDNQHALATVPKAGLRHRTEVGDGLSTVTIDLVATAGDVTDPRHVRVLRTNAPAG